MHLKDHDSTSHQSPELNNMGSHRYGVLSIRLTVLSEPFTVNSGAYNKKGAILFMFTLEHRSLIMQLLEIVEPTLDPASCDRCRNLSIANSADFSLGKGIFTN